MPTLVALREELQAKRAALAAILAEAGPEYDMGRVKSLDGDSAGKVAEIQRRSSELDALTDQVKGLAGLEQIHTANTEGLDWLEHPSGSGGGLVHPNGTASAGRHAGEIAHGRTLGDLVAAHDGYKQMVASSRPQFSVTLPDVSVKTVMTLTAGFAQEPRRTGLIVPIATRRPVVADLIPDDPTTQNSIRYMEQTTDTNNAAPVAEGAVKPESAMVWTERSVPVELIADTIPVTNQQIEDVPALRAVIDNGLTNHILLKEEDELLNGTGVTPRLLGFLQKPGIQTQAKGTDETYVAVYKAFTKVRWTGFAEPSGVIAHPDDWQDVRLFTTPGGVLPWGSPTESGIERIWGVPVIITTAIATGTMLVGDFRGYSHISRRMGITIEASTEHSDFFARNQILLRAEERLALEIMRAAAFCTVTGV